MKKLLLILFVGLGFSGLSQTFQWDTNDTIEVNLTPNTTEQYPTYQSAIGNDTVTLAIEVIYNDIPATWDGMLCIYGLCLGTIPQVGTQATMDPIFGSTQGMVRLTVNPYNGTEVAKLQVYVYDVNYPNDGDTATFLLNTTLGIDEHASATAFAVSPNPANDIISINAEQSFYGVTIFNTEGKIVKTVDIAGTTAEINVSDLKSGVYVIQLSGVEGIAQRRLVKR